LSRTAEIAYQEAQSVDELGYAKNDHVNVVKLEVRMFLEEGIGGDLVLKFPQIVKREQQNDKVQEKQPERRTVGNTVDADV